MLRFIARDPDINGFDPIVLRVRCFSHNLNLIAQAFLFGTTRQHSEARVDKDKAIKLAIREIYEL